MLELRRHQEEALQRLDADFNAGKKRLLLVMATGTGKTVTFLEWLRRERPSRALIIAHRRELIAQPLAAMEHFFPSLQEEAGVVMAEYDDYDRRIVVATVQTLKSEPRLRRLLAAGAFTHLVIDEAHHAVASSYKRVVDALREANPDLRLLGVTATPVRTDKDGLVQVFEKVSFNYPITRAIRDGVLVPFDALAFELPVTLVGLGETKDGWAREPLGDLLSAQNIMEIVFEKWREHAQDRPTIGFTASVRQAHALAAYFRERGVDAEAIDGTTDKETRDHILDEFRVGALQVVFNCMVLTEGFDAPEASVALMVAPTKSDLIYVQRMGRVLRLAPGKQRALILDFAAKEGRKIVSAGDVLGVPKHIKKAQSRAERAGVLLSGLSLDTLGRATSVPVEAVYTKVLDLLAESPLAWAFDYPIMTTSLGADRAAAIVLPDPERLEKAEKLRGSASWNRDLEALYQYLLRVRLFDVWRVQGWRWKAELVGIYDDAEEAKAEVELWERDAVLSERQKAWRRKEATEGQLKALAKLGVDAVESVTRGEASQLIQQKLTTDAVAREGKRVEGVILGGGELTIGRAMVNLGR